jgi:hypothetical protein
MPLVAQTIRGYFFAQKLKSKEVEIWKSVIGYRGLYEVSNEGRVKSDVFGRGKLLKPSDNGTGSLRVFLWKDGSRKARTVHRLVAEAFLNYNPVGRKFVIKRIDGDSANSSASNLQVITARENKSQRHIKSSSKFVGVSWHKRDRKWVAHIRIDGEKKHLGSFALEEAAGAAYQLELSTI